MSSSFRTVLTRATAELNAAGIEGAARDARRLLAHAAGCPAEQITLRLDEDVPDSASELLRGYVACRQRNQPIAQIIGEREFWGRHFRVSPDVLDPRPETETLVECALSGPEPMRILDLGTGSGAIIVTLLAEWPDATAVASDISEAALRVASDNAARADVADRLQLIRSDWFAEIRGEFDLIVSNPPYISEAEMQLLSSDVRDWEPLLALSPGGDGLDAYRLLSRGLAARLRPAGRALFEIGPAQARDVRQIVEAVGLLVSNIHRDIDGRDRVVEICNSG